MKFALKLFSADDDGIIPPRTKKNSPRIIPGVRHPILLPSKAYQEWLRGVLKHSAHAVRRQLLDLGLELPIEKPVSIAATIYRDRNVGDWTGFVDAIGDALQIPLWRCTHKVSKHKACGKTFTVPPILWGEHPHRDGKKVRDGLGILTDDRLIQDWDGTRLKKDPDLPRVELTITIFETVEQSLLDFDQDGDDEEEDDE